MASSQKQRMYAELDCIVQCPVCFELPQTSIYVCNKGHHYCEGCYEKVRYNNCPICKSVFSGTRNFVAEELVQKLPTLFISDTPKKPELSSERNRNNSESSSGEKLKPPQYCRGNFPCQLRSCLKMIHAGRMLPHIRYYHSTLLNEVTHAGIKYKEAWQLEYKSSKSYETAIRISSMGLFFLLTDINEQKDFHAIVLMLASTEVASNFYYKIKISDTKERVAISYKSKVLSCRENPLKNLNGSGYFEALAVRMSEICEEDNYFHCTLVIVNQNPEYVDSPSSARCLPSPSRVSGRAVDRNLFAEV